MEKETRNTLRNVVAQCRRLLEDAIGEQLEGHFGIHRDGQIEDRSRMGHLSEEDQRLRADVVESLRHIQATMLGGGKISSDAVEQLVREVGFTHLNRLCAFKMLEHRKLMRDAIGRGVKSNGFLFYLRDHSEDENLWSGGQQDEAYRHFLLWLAETLSDEVGALFSAHDPANRLFPPHRVVEQILALINGDELRDVWSEDEAIGWVYQYYTPKELRDKSRKESQSPRNSYELAFRNQFYTPRYVVQFLVDNTLGRTWYAMRRGDTSLTTSCRYLVRRPNEIFLRRGESEPATASEDSVYIEYREKKDPRQIRVLDPACGSGHFLLYCFDLFETIYAEAYHDAELGPELRQEYPDPEGYRRAVPELIVRENLHGIDIDLRATQIASLALWLRARRAYEEIGVGNEARPCIRRANLVCAEPMPGESDLLDEFVRQIQPSLLGQLSQRVFSEMRLASEAGSLLRIERAIHEDIERARAQWKARPKEEQLLLWPQGRRPKPEQLTLFDVAGITDEEFWDEAENRLLEALRTYAGSASDVSVYARGLFSEDAAQGFGFVDVSRKRYDVVLMNPPFGEASKPSKAYVEHQYPRTKNDVFAAFVERGLEWLHTGGMLGAITSRTGFFLSSFQKFREEILLEEGRPTAVADLGNGVLDTAMVETAAYCVMKRC
jgi:hypothetical protein